MATSDNRIRFNILSTFNGEGFTKANGALQTAGRAGKQTMEVLGGLAGEATQLGGVMGKLAGGVKNVVSGFASFGVLGGIMAGIKVGIDAVGDHLKSKADEVLAKTNALHDKVKAKFDGMINAMMGNVNAAFNEGVTNAKRLVAELDSMSAAYAKVSAAQAQIMIAQGNRSISDLQIDKLNDMIKEETEAGKALVAAQCDVRIAEAKHAAAVNAAADAEEAARNAVEDARRRREQLEGLVNSARAALATAIEEEEKAASVESARLGEFTAAREKAANAVADAENQLALQTVNIEAAEKNLERVEIEATIRRNEANAQVTAEKDQLARLQAAEKKREEAELRAASQQTQRAELQMQEQLLKTAADDQIAALTKDIEDAKQDAKKAAEARDRTKRGMEKDQQVHRGIGGEGFDYQTDAKGDPLTMREWERAQRYADRADRDQARLDRADAANERKAKDLQNKLDNGKKLTDAEKDWLGKWNKRDWERNAEERARQQQQRAEEQIRKIREKLGQDVAAIRQKMDRIGLQ